MPKPLLLALLTIALPACTYHRTAGGETLAALGGSGKTKHITYNNNESFKDGTGLLKHGLWAQQLGNHLKSQASVDSQNITSQAATRSQEISAQTTAGTQAADLERLRIENSLQRFLRKNPLPTSD